MKCCCFGLVWFGFWLKNGFENFLSNEIVSTAELIRLLNIVLSDSKTLNL